MAKISGIQIPAELKNLAINGAFDFWQRVAATQLTITTNQNAYAADMFQFAIGGATSKSVTVGRSSNVPTLAQSGFQSPYSYGFTNTNAVPSPAAGDIVQPCQYRMEGLDYVRIHNGKTITFGFWALASVPGTYSFSMRNAAAARSYVTTFTISGAATWQFISISAPTDTTGTWNFDNTTGIIIDIGAFGGTTFQTSALNTWQAGNFSVASTATNYLTAGATLNIAQFSIVEGPLGFGATGFMRCGRDVQQELAMCQRYYEKSQDLDTAPTTASAPGCFEAVSPTSAQSVYCTVSFRVFKRITNPLCIVYSIGTATANTFRNISVPNDVTAATEVAGMAGFAALTGAAGIANNVYKFQWTADAGL